MKPYILSFDHTYRRRVSLQIADTDNRSHVCDEAPQTHNNHMHLTLIAVSALSPDIYEHDYITWVKHVVHLYAMLPRVDIETQKQEFCVRKTICI